jgi:hypothetical protein
LPEGPANEPPPQPPSFPPENPDQEALCFGAVLAEELQEIAELRKKRGVNGQAPSPDILAMANPDAVSGPCVKDPKVSATHANKIFSEAHKMGLVGLAFSGGGIRSATFNLGILQGLADKGLLRKFDYLSTVSGGGYIGGWLEAWILREGRIKKKDAKAGDDSPCQEDKWDCKEEPGIGVVEDELKTERKERREKLVAEPQAIRFLREYSNYLTPRRGLLGADTWTMVAIYLRNLLLNQAILTLFLFSLLLLPYIAVWITRRASGWKVVLSWIASAISLDWVSRLLSKGGFVSDYLPLGCVSLLLLVALILGMKNIKVLLECGMKQKEKTAWFPQGQGWILVTIVGPILLAAWILTVWLWNRVEWWDNTKHLGYWVIGGAVALGVPWLVGFHSAGLPKRRDEGTWDEKYATCIWPVSILATGAVSGLLMYAAFHEIFARLHGFDGAAWHELTIGVPVTLMVFLLAAALQIGLMGLSFVDPYREWWARAAGWMFILTLTWLAWFSLSLYAPVGVLWLHGWLQKTVTATWVLTTAAGVLGGKNSKTGDPNSNDWKDKALSVTPYVFVAGLASLLSFCLELILAKSNWTQLTAKYPTAWSEFLKGSPQLAKVANWVLNLTGTFASPTLTVSGTAASQSAATTTPAYLGVHWKILCVVTNWRLLPLCIGALLVCLILSWRVDLNEFSMHLFYRNRLVRCYLGATHKNRDPNPFTGFDACDDLCLKALQSRFCYSGPFPIFNATLNLVSTRDLAWQERKGESFSMTPLRCGYDRWLEELDLYGENVADEKDLDKFAYRPTGMYGYADGGFFVGTAMGISGAALSPNMGFYSQPGLAMLMTFFNVRLGFWAGNPRQKNKETWTRPGPRLGLTQLLSELFGQTDDAAKYVYLSDGGHFENLGVYELVKRRCKYIIACDAGADPDYKLGDLGNAIRRCREDIGVEINLDHVSDVLVPQEAKNGDKSKRKLTRWHCYVGEICYDMVDTKDGAPLPKEENGTFVYVKASLTGEEPADVLNYQTAQENFPHETTADQWFTESQFESYRRLGQHIMEMVFTKDVLEHKDNLDALFKELNEAWGAKKAEAEVKKQAAQHQSGQS